MLFRTIASRYKTLPGPGGRSRSFIIHDRLWEYLQRMISRMFFSQEQFGGGFCGAGQKLGDQGRLRTLGTIERYYSTALRDLFRDEFMTVITVFYS